MIFQYRRKASKSSALHRRTNRRVEIEALECRRLFNALLVTTDSDATSHTGVSLRDAIASADFDAALGISDTITFEVDAIELSQGQLELNSGGGTGVITIDGASQVSIIGDGSDRVFSVDSGTNAVLTELGIWEGSPDGVGGGLVNEGNLTLNSCEFYANGSTGDGGAIYNTGTLNVNTTTFYANGAGQGEGNTPNGGAIYNDGGSMTISDSTFKANSAEDDGGAIDNAGGGTATVSGSTFYLNGSIAAADGGAIENDSTMTVINSTFNQNTASDDGGGIENTSALTVTNSTLSGNTGDETGGGIASTGTCELLSTIVAGNASTDGSVDADGTFQSSSYNLIGDGTGEVGMTNGSDGNQVALNALSSEDYVDALAYNGGPTQTMVPVPYQSGINAGGEATYLNDPINSTQTSIPVGRASAIASTAGDYVIRVGSEQMLVTGVDLPDNSLTVVRGYDGTTAASENFATAVYVATDQTGQLRDSAPDIGAFEFQPLFSTVAPLPATETSTSFPVSWSGHPASGDSPIAYYTIYDSDNGANYTVWLAETTATSATFTGTTGHTYSFYSIATTYPDGVYLGQTQATPGTQATTTVVAPAAPAFTSSSQKTFTAGVTGSFTAAASGSPAPTFSESGALPNGVTFNTTGVLSGTPASGTVGTYPLTLYAFNGVGAPASQSFDFIVAKASTTTKLTKNTSGPIKYGQSVTFTVTVAPVGANILTPGGSGAVILEINGTPFEQATPSNGVATFMVNDLPPGANSMSAAYDGDANFSGSASGSITQTVDQSSTTTKLTKSTTGAVTYGQSVTLTATMAAVSPGAGTPTGTVTFMDGTTVLGTGTVNNGVATLTTTTIPAGSNSIDAVYSGDTDFTTSMSSALSQTVNKSATTTKLTKSTTAAITYGQSVTFTATMAAVSPGAGTPTGTVTFMDGSTALGTGTLSGGIATLTTTTIPAGSNSIDAVYGGDSNFTTSTSGTLSQTVNKSATTTKLTKNTTGPITSGTSVTFTATVAAVSPGAGIPATGDTVTFMDNGSSIGTGALSSAGVATLITTTLPVGSNSITAIYSGDTDYTTSTSNALSQTVNS